MTTANDDIESVIFEVFYKTLQIIRLRFDSGGMIGDLMSLLAGSVGEVYGDKLLTFQWLRGSFGENFENK